MLQLQQFDFRITYVTGWRAYLGNAQHNYAHWTKVVLPEGRHDLSTLEQIPGVLPFEVYAQAPLRLISWCSFELDHRAKALVRELAILCENPTTTNAQLVEHIGQRHANIQTEQAATQYLATLATVHIASRAQMPSYTTMVQHFLSTLKLPMAIYMLDYYLPMLSPNEWFTMKQDSPCRVLALSAKNGNPSTVVPVSRERVRPLESHRGIRRICLPASQPRPYRCTPIVGKRSTPSQSLSHWDGATYCNGRCSQRRRCNQGKHSMSFLG